MINHIFEVLLGNYGVQDCADLSSVT